MGILTISDYQNATEEERGEMLSKVTIKQDLDEWLRWLNLNQGSVDFPVELRYGGVGRSKGIHPSSVKRGTCPKKLYYECTGELDKITTTEPDLQRTFDIGTMMHCWTQAHLKKMYGEQFEDEVPLKDEELHITGHTDGLFSFTYARIILEIKSIKEGGNFGVDKIRSAPMDEHVWQGHLYMKCADVPVVLFLYFCKNNSDIVEHAVPFNEKVWSDIVNLIEPVVNAAYNDGPPVEATPGSACYRCNYFNSGCEDGRRYRSNAEERKTGRAKEQLRRFGVR